jgi:hypothetical protein
MQNDAYTNSGVNARGSQKKNAALQAGRRPFMFLSVAQIRAYCLPAPGGVELIREYIAYFVAAVNP